MALIRNDAKTAHLCLGGGLTVVCDSLMLLAVVPICASKEVAGVA